jgi:hypothetical protein
MKGTTRHMILKQFFRLLVVIVILLSGSPLRAQGPFDKYLRPNNSFGLLLNRIHPDSVSVPPLDTLASAPNGSIAVKNGTFYVKWTFWHEVTGNNIYNANGTLTATRTVSQNGFAVSFNGGQFNVQSAIASFTDYGSLNINSSESRMDYTTGSGSANFRLLPQSGVPRILYTAQKGTGENTNWEVLPTQITFRPWLGALYVDTLATSSDTTSFKPIGHNPTTGALARMPYWLGSGASGLVYHIGNVQVATFDSSLYFPTWDTTYILAKATKFTGNKSIAGSKAITDSTKEYLAELVGDLASPGNNMLYGTNASGVKGWYTQPTGGGGAESDPLSIRNQYTLQTGAAFHVKSGNVDDTLWLPGGSYVTKFNTTGTWIDMSNANVSGLGDGGVGSNAWIARAHTNGQWFTDALANDICIRSSFANVLIGTGSTAPTYAIKINNSGNTVTFKNAPTFSALAGTGNALMQLNSLGTSSRSSIDPANIQLVTTVATGLTAAGTDQSTALALSGNNSVQEVTTAASGTGVKLPTASSTSRVAVINRGANDLTVYPTTSGVINGQSANAGFTIPAGGSAVFVGKDATSWYMEQAMRGGDVQNTDASKALTINANAVTTTKINNGAVTLSKMENRTTQTLIGRNTAGSGTPEEISASQVLDWFSATQGTILYRSATGWAALAVGTDGQVLTTHGASANPTWTTASGGGMSNPMTTLGDIIYEDATPTAARLPGNTTSTKKFLTQTGTGTVSAAPGWNTLVAGDIPDISATYVKNQSASSQTGSIWVSGQIKTDGAVNVGTNLNIGNQATINLGANPYAQFSNGWSNQGGYKFWGASGGTLLFQLDYTQTLTAPGNLIIGSGDLTGMTDGSKFSVRLDNSANGVNLGTFRVNQTASSTSVSTALQPWLRTTHSSGTVADVRTFVAVYDQGSANAVTEARVGEFSALMSNATGGTISTLKMVQASMSANTSTATTVTNSYGFFYKAPGGAGTITLTNPTYAFYNDDANAQSLFKGKFFLPSLGTTTPDKSLGYVSSTGEVVALNSVQTAQGSYTPTTSNLANITSETTGTAYYTRTGNVVSVDGFYSPTVTATGTACSVKFTLPVTSDLTGNDLYGVITSSDNTASGTVTWDATNDKAIIQFKSTITTPSLNFHFSYRVQ